MAKKEKKAKKDARIKIKLPFCQDLVWQKWEKATLSELIN